MAYIYKITNQINGKIYIGKTVRTIKVRWHEHNKDFISGRKSHLPLYKAFAKYGIENFQIEEIEECSDLILEERERYWIETYGSFKNGYNATIGGDGRPYIDYDMVCALYQELQNQKQVAQKMGIDRTTVSYILKNRGMQSMLGCEATRISQSKQVKCYNLKGDFIQIFSSITEAAQWLINNHNLTAKLNSVKTNIGRCIKGKRQTCYGLIWKSIDV